MDEFLQEIYLGQVKQECEHCFHSIHVMNAIMNKQIEGDFFQPALDLIHHAAAVSRIFWPSGGRNNKSAKRAKRRGQLLRDLLELSSDHAVQDRTLRDHFEHFDERLDDWAETSKHRNIVQRFIGPRTTISGNSIQDSDIIHHYDPQTKIFGFRGEKFDIQALAKGLDDIYKRASQKLEELEANKRFQPKKKRVPPPKKWTQRPN